MLTVGADNIAGTNGNDTITVVNVNGVGTAATTAQSFDKVDGGAGTDTLNWYATATENATIAGTYSNIEVVNFYGAEKIARAKDDSGTNGIVTANIDASLIGGSQQVWIQSAAAIDTTFSTKGTPTSGGIVVTGLSGKTLGVAGKTAESITGNFGTGAAAALALNAASNAAGTGNASVDITGVATSLAVSGAGKATLTDNGSGADTIKTLTVAATGATTLNVTGLGALTAIDGSASTSDTTLVGIAATAASIKTGAGKDTFTVTATAKATVDSGAGDDTVTLASAVASGSTINLGAGNDKLLAGVGSVAASTTTVIDGGDGIDTVAASLINAGNAAQFKNFEALDISAAANLDVALMTGSTITGLTLTGNSAAATVSNVAAGVGLSVADDNSGVLHTIGVKNAATGTADSFAITFNGADVAGSAPVAANVKAGTVVVDEVESLSIASTGGVNTWNSIAVTDNKLQTLTITGDKNLGLTFVSTNGTNGAVAGSGGAVKTIDGSAATGKLSINTTGVTADDKAGVGLTVKGGSANDTITLAQKATVDAGAGDDTIVSAVAGGTFTGGAGKDVFNVKVALGNVVTITDFVVGTDKLAFADHGTETFTATKVNIAAATNLTDALNLAAAGDGNTNTAITWFQYGADTYVVADAGAGATFNAASDVAVKLTGLVDLSTLTVADFSFVA